MLKKITALALLAATVSAQAITWKEYYQAHEKEVIAAVAAGELELEDQGLTDLVGFDQVPGLNKLKDLNLSDNELSSLEGIGNLPALEVLDLAGNQLTDFDRIDNFSKLRSLYLESNQLTTLAGIENLSLLKDLDFSNNPIPKPEDQLLDAVRNGQDLSAVRRWFSFIADGVVKGVHYYKDEGTVYGKISIPSIRDEDGNNVLDIAVQTAAQRLARVRHKINSNKELSETERTRQIQKYSTALNDFYTKILNILLSCDQQCVREMLYTPNAQGQTVIEAVLRRLGPDSPIVKVIQNALSQSHQQ